MNNKVIIDDENVSLRRINAKCKDCGVCKKTCDELNHLDGDCINCGQCILTCPFGALVPKYDYQQVLNYLYDTDYTVVVLTSPAVRVQIGDEFGYKPGEFLEKKLVGVLRELGFNYVFDTTFGADLTVMEESLELCKNIEEGKRPLFSSCCPSWVLYMQKKHPNDISYLSTALSPIEMIGKMVKTYFADLNQINPKKIITVALTPCVSKKYERTLNNNIDFTITTRELVLMIREMNIDFKNTKDSEYDLLLAKGSGAGLIFATSGGVCESILRTTYYMLNGKKAPSAFYNLREIRGICDFKEAIIDMGIVKIKVAVVNSMKSVEKYYKILKDYDFVEVMTCPGGCIGGAGQSLNAIKDKEIINEERMKSIYEDDRLNTIRNSYSNPDIQIAYDIYINKNNIKLHKNHLNFTKNEKDTIISEVDV